MSALYVATLEIASDCERDDDLFVSVYATRREAIVAVLTRVGRFTAQDLDCGESGDQAFDEGIDISNTILPDLNNDELEELYDDYRMSMHWYNPSVFVREIGDELSEMPEPRA